MYTVTLNTPDGHRSVVELPHIGCWIEQPVMLKRATGYFAHVWELTTMNDVHHGTAEYRGLRRLDPLHGAGTPRVNASRLLHESKRRRAHADAAIVVPPAVREDERGKSERRRVNVIANYQTRIARKPAIGVAFASRPSVTYSQAKARKHIDMQAKVR